MNNSNLEQEFIEKVTASQGIVHKVSGMYCDHPEDRKDLVQEIMVNLWKSYPKFRGDSKFSTWMYRVSLNIAIQHLRKEKKKKEDATLPGSFESFAQEEHSEEPTLEMIKLRKAIDELNDVEKAIVMLYLEDKPNEEIADIIGITQNYVRVKMTRIRTKLKTLMEAK